MSDVNQLVFAEAIFCGFGREETKWVVARKRKDIPTSEAAWGFPLSAPDYKKDIDIVRISREEIEKLGLENLKHGIDVVSQEISDYYIILC